MTLFRFFFPETKMNCLSCVESFNFLEKKWKQYISWSQRLCSFTFSDSKRTKCQQGLHIFQHHNKSTQTLKAIFGAPVWKTSFKQFNFQHELLNLMVEIIFLRSLWAQIGKVSIKEYFPEWINYWKSSLFIYKEIITDYWITCLNLWSCSVSVFGVSAESMQCSYDSKGNSVPSILLLMQERLYSCEGLKVPFCHQ